MRFELLVVCRCWREYIDWVTYEGGKRAWTYTSSHPGIRKVCLTR